MKTLLKFILVFCIPFYSFGQQITVSEYFSKLKESPKTKLEHFTILANEFVEHLDKSDSFDTDKAFIELLKVQTTIQNNYNNYIYEFDGYDKIESIIYSNENLHTKEAKEFKKYVYENGFVIQTPEGTIFIEKDPDFLLKKFSPFLSEVMNLYLKQYCLEIKEPFGEDGGITISFDDFKQRVLFWEDFKNEHQNFVLPKYAKNQYEYYFHHLLDGADNTPAFDWQTKKLSDSYRIVYNEIILENPESETSIILKKYIELLEKNQFERTEEVEVFIDKYSPYK